MSNLTTYPLQPPHPPPVPTIDPPLECGQRIACPNRAGLFTTDHFGTLYALCTECASELIKSETNHPK